MLKDIQFKLDAFLQTGGKAREDEQRAQSAAIEKDKLEGTLALVSHEREVLRGQIVDMEREVNFQKSRYEFEHEGKKELEKRIADLTAMLE